MRKTVVMVAFDGVQLLDLAGPVDVFDAATKSLGMTADQRHQLATDFNFDDNDAIVGACGTGYQSIVATPAGRVLRTSAGLRISADVSLSELRAERVDTVIVPGALSMTAPLRDRRLLRELPRVAESARRVCSVCGGAFLLAEAGLLAGRRATTHWAGGRLLAETYPDVTVEPDRIFVRDGNITTSAGVTAGIDLTLALVEEDHGPEIARTVARWLVVFLYRSGGQSQFSARLNLPVHSDSPIRAIVDQIVVEPAGDHRVSALAERVALSERQLARVFLHEAQTTPARFVERVRVEAARDLLENTKFGYEAIASRCGFGSVETMRRAFIRVLGIGPGRYRERFRSAVGRRG